MRRPLAPALLLALFLALPAPCAADSDALAGEWTITGRDAVDPAGITAYSGWATLTRHGEAYILEELVDGVRYQGVGLFDPKTGVLSLSFQNLEDQETGVAQFRLDQGVLEGRWVNLSAPEEPGLETWRRDK